MVAGTDLRRHWRGTIAVALLVGLVGGTALAALAGARRSAASLGRFQDTSRSSNLQFSVSTYRRRQLDALRSAPGVEGVGIAELLFIGPASQELRHIQIAATVDRRLGTEVDRPRVVAGRLANPEAVYEVNIGEGLAAQTHLRVGDTLPTASMSRKDFIALQHGGRFRFAGPRPQLRVVGIVRRPLDLASLGSAGGVVLMTPAFDHAYRGRIANVGGYVFRVRSVDATAAEHAARRIFGKDPSFLPQNLTIESAGARDAINVITDVLLIFAAVVAVAGTVAIAIVLSRELASTRPDQPALDALGATRLQRAGMTGGRVLAIAGGGTLLALILAVAASPFLPIGVARRADPDGGLHADWFVLLLGAVGLIAVVLAIASVAALHSTRLATGDEAARALSLGSRMSTALGGLGLPPVATTGVRMATQAGRGERAVPVRSAVFGIAFGAFGLCALLVFASNLSHLSTTPADYGWTFDFKAETTATQGCNRKDLGVSKWSGVESIGIACYTTIQFAGRPLTAWALIPVKGHIGPAIVEGRAPQTPQEVALGATTLHALGKHVGDIVRTRGPRGRTVAERIVGQAVFPQLDDAQPLADGAWFTGPGWYAAGATDEQPSRDLVGTYAPGADRAMVDRRINALRGANRVQKPLAPTEIDRLTNIDWFPTITAALLAVLAFVAVAHAIATSTRRRRRDLAVLQTLGFGRPQVRHTVEWQATAMAVAGLVVGVPLGVIAGVAVWRPVAHGLGVRAEPALPLTLLLVAPVAILAVNLIAAVPGRTASRHRPAVSLRSE
jgi:hypothetical protein